MKSALNRREFNGLCGALGSFVASFDAATAIAANSAVQTVKLRDGTIVSAVGQGRRLKKKKHYGRAFHSA